MPIQSRVNAGAFDPETIRILSAAFEDAWRSLNVNGMVLGPHTDAVRDALAKSIIDAAAGGERDARRLRETALARLARSVGRDITPRL
jgi:hypothetical protein